MKIFRSIFNLKYTQTKINRSYIKKTEETINKYNFLFIIYGLIFSAISLIVFFDALKDQKFQDEVINMIFFYETWVQCASYLLILIPLHCVFKNRNSVQKYLNYINYYLLNISGLGLRYYVFSIMKADNNFYSFLLFLDFISRAIWVFVGFMDFVETILTSFIFLVTVFILFSPAYKSFYLQGTYNIILLMALHLLSIIISYFITKERKIAFYFNYELEKKIFWYENILETMNSGFMQVSNKEVHFMNRKLVEIFMKNKEIRSIFDNENCEMQTNFQENSELFNKWLSAINLEKFMLVLFNKISKDTNLNNTVIPEEDDFSYECLIRKLKERYLSHNDKNFLFLGCLEFKSSPTISNTYEIFFRYYQTKDEDKKCFFEFIFNDVTRTKVIEGKNTEIKYKTMILSKIAHEFKNPLICIGELCQQLCENEINDTFKSNTKKNLYLISSLSQYLLILIKDLDYFSVREKRQVIKINKSSTNLEKVIQFCKEVAQGILIKFKKENKLKFIVIKEKSLPIEIITDEIKLKQVIINLISNSIKFTKRGKIILKVRKTIDSYIEFIVEDTGEGMTDKQKKNLFKPYMEGIKKKDNELGAGLGLSIVYEMTTKLGKTVEFESKVGKGTKFWFSLPLRELNLNVTNPQKDNMNEMSHININHPENFSHLNLNNISLESYYEENSSNDTKVYIGLSKYFDRNEFQHFLDDNPNISFQSEEISNNNLNIDSNKNEIIKINIKRREYNVIVADDDPIVRKANIRILNNVSHGRNMKINIIEAEDGFEAIKHIHNFMKQGLVINCVISDQTMDFMDGTKTAKFIHELYLNKSIPYIPFFLLTAYDDFKISNLPIEQVFCKPLNNQNGEMLLKLMSKRFESFDKSN